MGVPICACLWERMRRLDPHCNINLIRTATYDKRLPRTVARSWQVNLSRGPGETIQIERPRLTDALEIAVQEAERLGWPARKRPANLPPPISEELWDRLGRLDAQGVNMSIGRRDVYSLKLAESYSRTWTCNFYRESLGVSIALPSLTEALTLAVEECERRGSNKR